MPTRLTTDTVTLNERSSYWNVLVSSVLGRLDTIPARSNFFRGVIDYSQLATIPIAQVGSTQLTVHRPEKFIDQPEEDFYKVNFQLVGEATLTQNKRLAQLQPGQWVIYDNTRPYQLQFHTDYQQLLFLVPRHQMMSRLPTVDLMLAKPLSSQKGMGKLLLSFALNALQESEEISPAYQQQTAQTMLDLLLFGLNTTGEQSARMSGNGRYEQMCQFIDAHLHEPSLSAASLAEQFHLSKRMVQKIFASNGSTVEQTIWPRRLQMCQRDLQNPSLIGMSIQDIALSWGFRSNAHFARKFKQQFGMTPKAYRQQFALSQ
ncbi:MAG: helix-turn-helix domain-containing protein [Chloroflexota bacterium]